MEWCEAEVRRGLRLRRAMIGLAAIVLRSFARFAAQWRGYFGGKLVSGQWYGWAGARRGNTEGRRGRASDLSGGRRIVCANFVRGQIRFDDGVEEP